LLADDSLELPLEFVALTVKVYDVEAVKPLTVIGDDPVPVKDPGVDVAVNEDAVAPKIAAV
jgi:hypothetical protein